MSAARRGAVVADPVVLHGVCAVCQGPITFYPRRQEDSVPRTRAVDDARRWAHDRVGDWLAAPHRACPRETAHAEPAVNDEALRRGVGHAAATRER